MAEVVDADSHVYEPPAIWDHYVPDGDRRHGAGRPSTTRSTTRGTAHDRSTARPASDLNRRTLVRQAIWRPGMTPDDIGALDPDVFVAAQPGRRTTRPPGWPTWTPWASTRRSSSRRCSASTCRWSTTRRPPPCSRRAYNDWVWDFAAADGRPRAPGRDPAPPVALLASTRAAIGSAEQGLRVGALIRPAFYKLGVDADSLQRRRSARARAPMLGGAESAAAGGVRRGQAVPAALGADRPARHGGVRAPVARHHRPRRHLQRRLRRAGVGAPRRRPHHRRADRLHAGRRPVRHRGAVPRPVRGPARPASWRSPTPAPPGCRSRWRSARPTSGWAA